MFAYKMNENLINKFNFFQNILYDKRCINKIFIFNLSINLKFPIPYSIIRHSAQFTL